MTKTKRVLLTCRVDPDLITKLDRAVKKVKSDLPALNVDRSAIIRTCLINGLAEILGEKKAK